MTIGTSGNELDGTVTVSSDGFTTRSPASLSLPSSFTVISGPCTVSSEGMCVGRPQGYGPNEACNIEVRGEGTLGACPVFQTVDYGTTSNHCGYHVQVPRCDTISIASGGVFSGWTSQDAIDLGVRPCANTFGGVCNGCPAGTLLVAGERLTWSSGEDDDTVVNCDSARISGISDMAGWELCFA